MGATLSLGRREEATPVFSAEAHYGEVHGSDARYVQGKNYFGHAGQFLREAPPEAWMAPLSAEQEQARRLQMQKNKGFFNAAKKPGSPGASVPQSVIAAERENAQARAAEHRAS